MFPVSMKNLHAIPTRPEARASFRNITIGIAIEIVAIMGALIIQSVLSPVLSFAQIPDPPPSASTTELIGIADGVLPDGVVVFDDTYPGVTSLNAEILQALRLAASDAASDGIEFFVTSGWRSPSYQDQLLQKAIAEYGSEGEARRWVATADTSAHVKGLAVDIGAYDAMDWLARFGAEYGLCRIYENEPWHFELRPEAVVDGCPAMYADPTEDPRMQLS
jgi:D-alanyl-D-alanine carboxypeptidase